MADHYFFALALPTSIKVELEKISEEIQNDFPFKKWVVASDYHITLAFLGAAESGKLEQALKNIEVALPMYPAFMLEINHLGTFGQRILWAGMKESEALLGLQARVYTACQKAGFSLEKRPFQPHITLARKWEGNIKIDMEKMNSYLHSLEFSATEVVLYKTNLDQIPKYEKMERMLLPF